MLTELGKTDKQGNHLPAELRYTTANLQEGTGGDWVTRPGMVLMNRPNSKGEKDANHDLNSTRNFYDTVNQKYVKIHPILIDRFQGKTVIW
jgi:hypothetical protein